MADRKRQANVLGGRPVRRVVKLSASEDAALMVAAAELGVTVPRFLKESALALSRGESATERRALITELFGVQRHLAAVGNNLNQIARGVNIDGTVREDLVDVLEHLRGTLRDADQVLESLALDRGV